MNDVTYGVECGKCGSGPVYFETCPHEWATASECQHCGVRHEIEPICEDCERPTTAVPPQEKP